jgi:hypothetical protein
MNDGGKLLDGFGFFSYQKESGKPLNWKTVKPNKKAR